MTLEQARKQVGKNIAAKGRPVDQTKVRKFKKELAEDYSKYLIESRVTAKKTAEMSKIVCVG
ncbi:MAG: hypothetical protein PVI26_08595 [Chitinispirillia bacterium]|jgi:hypothetical protein